VANNLYTIAGGPPAGHRASGNIPLTGFVVTGGPSSIPGTFIMAILGGSQTNLQWLSNVNPSSLYIWTPGASWSVT